MSTHRGQRSRPHTHAPSAALGHAAPASVRGGGANGIQGLIICARPLIMTSTLLHACLRGCCRRDLQYVALTFSQGLGLPQKRTHELVDDIEMHASSSDGNHEAVCRFLLSTVMANNAVDTQQKCDQRSLRRDATTARAPAPAPDYIAVDGPSSSSFFGPRVHQGPSHSSSPSVERP